MHTVARNKPAHESDIYVDFLAEVEVDRVKCGPDRDIKGAWLPRDIAKRLVLAKKAVAAQPPAPEQEEETLVLDHSEEQSEEVQADGEVELSLGDVQVESGANAQHERGSRRR